MSRLGAAALRQAVTASLVSSSSSRSAAFAPASSRLFSTDASGEAAGAGAGSQDDYFPKSSGEGLAYGRFYSVIYGGIRLGKNMLKTDIIHYLDKCDLSLDDVKIVYNRGYYPMTIRQTSQGRLYKLERMNRDEWDLKQSYDGKAILLQGVPRNALPEDIERFLCGANIEPSPFESFLRFQDHKLARPFVWWRIS